MSPTTDLPSTGEEVPPDVTDPQPCPMGILDMPGHISPEMMIPGTMGHPDIVSPSLMSTHILPPVSGMHPSVGPPMMLDQSDSPGGPPMHGGPIPQATQTTGRLPIPGYGPAGSVSDLSLSGGLQMPFGNGSNPAIQPIMASVASSGLGASMHGLQPPMPGPLMQDIEPLVQVMGPTLLGAGPLLQGVRSSIRMAGLPIEGIEPLMQDAEQPIQGK